MFDGERFTNLSKRTGFFLTNYFAAAAGAAGAPAAATSAPFFLVLFVRISMYWSMLPKPFFFNKEATVLDGFAPLLIQYSMRSFLSSKAFALVAGW